MAHVISKFSNFEKRRGIFVVIQFYFRFLGSIQIIVYNNIGIITGSFDLSGDQPVQIFTKDFPDGLYFVKAVIGTEDFTQT